jgi:hypothetical protein
MGYQLVETIEVGSGGAASIEFTGIPQDGVGLQILVSGRLTGSADAADLRFNSDSGNNYSQIRLTGTGSAVSSYGFTADRINVEFSGNNQTANTFGNLSIYVSNYASTANKSVSIDAVTENNATAAKQELTAGSYSTSSGITSLKLIKAFAEFSTASIYKITAD